MSGISGCLEKYRKARHFHGSSVPPDFITYCSWDYPVPYIFSLSVPISIPSDSGGAGGAMVVVHSATNKLVWQLLPPESPLYIAVAWGTYVLPGTFQIPVRSAGASPERGPDAPVCLAADPTPIHRVNNDVDCPHSGAILLHCLVTWPPTILQGLALIGA